MAYIRERNSNYEPIIGNEGEFLKQLPIPPGQNEDKFWFDGLKACDRIFYHQTLSSARRYAPFKQYSVIPKNSIDLILLSQYNHSTCLFGDKYDVALTSETLGKETFRQLRNYRTSMFVRPGHPLHIGGILEKVSPHSVKLINTGTHTPLTNPGFSRQQDGGFIYNY